MVEHVHHDEHDALPSGDMDPAQAARVDVIRAAGLRVTSSRLAVLERLDLSGGPLTHHELVDQLRAGPWNRSTLYRNLIDLTEAGLAKKTEIGGLMRFERAGRVNPCHEHPHFVCIDCGEVTHLAGVVVRVEGKGEQHAVASGNVEVQLRGVCNDCAPPAT